MSSGGGTTTQQAQTQTAPWQPAQPYLTDLFGQAQNTYQNAQGQGGTFPNTVAPLSQTTQNALSGITNLAQQGSAPIVGQANSALGNILSGNTLQGGQLPGNSALTSLANSNPTTTANAVFNATAPQVTDAVNSQFEAGDRTGSASNQQELTRNLGQLAANDYGQAVGNQMTAAQNLNTDALGQGQQATTASAFAVPSLANQQYVPLQNELTAGQTYDAQNQAQLNNNLAQWSYGQQQPWNILNNYSGVLTGLGSLGGTSSGTSSTTQPSQSLLPSLIGGAGQFAGSAGGSALLASLL